MHRPSRTFAVALLLAGLAAPSLADIDTEIDRIAVVKGSFESSNDVERFQFEAPAGATLSLSLIGKKGDVLDVDVELRSPTDAPVDLSAAPVLKDVGKKITVKRLLLPSSGTYSLRVSGDAAGEYLLKLSVKPHTTWSGATFGTASQSTSTADFSAPAGSKLTLSVKPAKRSPAVGRWDSVQAADVSGSGKLKTTSHKVTIADSGDTVDQTATLRNAGDATGDLVWTVKVKPPKLKKQKLDVRTSTLGGSADGGTSLARTVNAQTGGAVLVDDPGVALDGAEVIVPAGALAQNQRISIASALALPPPNPETQQTVGPAITLGPAGVTFAQPVDVWVPFDPQALPVGFDPAQLTVLKVSANGAPELIPVVEVSGSRVRVQLTSFSTVVAFSAKGTPRLAGSSFWQMFIELEALPDFANDNSGRRELFLGLGSVDIGPESTPDAFAVELEDRAYRIDQTSDGRGTLDVETVFETETASWTYGPTGQSLVVTGFDAGETDEWQLSADGSLLISTHETPGEAIASLDILVRKPTQRPTTASMAGKYWFATFGLGASVNGDGRLCMDLFRGFGELTLNANGTLHVQDQQGERLFEPGSNEFASSVDSDSSDGTFTVQSGGTYDGSLLFTLPFDEPGDPDVLRVFPSSGGQIMIGTDRDTLPDEVIFLVCVRQASGLKKSDLNGALASLGLEYEGVPYSVSDPSGTRLVPDFRASSISETLTFDNGKIRTPGFLVHGWNRDESVSGGLRIGRDDEVGDEEFRFSLSGNGRFGLPGGEGDDALVGAFTQDGSFGLYVLDPGGRENLFGLSFFFAQPPTRP